MVRTAPRVLAVGVLAALVLSAGPLRAQEPVWYTVDLANAVHHEARISVTFPDLPEAGTLELRMSRSSPGRYALHEFGKNVYRVEAADGMGRALPVEKPDPYTWTVAHPAGDVTVSYTLFADRADGTYSGIDRAQAHLNAPATFLWARGQEDRAIRVDLRPPEASRWQVATQLPEGRGDYTFTAPDLAYLLDSPIHLGEITFREWRVRDGSGHRVRVAVDHDGTDAEVDDFADGVRAIVEASRAVWGTYPDFDYDEYTFLAVYLPWVGGDGMEHRNSTSLTSAANLRTGALGLLGTVAHEFFHAWNVERIRPASLEPFDFERANMSRELWFAEGFTSYYTNLLLRRAGLIDDDAFASRIGGVISTVTNSPGRLFRSPVEMSMYAPFVDRAVSVDPTNHENTFLSYYTWGSAIGLALDLALRSSFPGAGLSTDAYMRAAWERFGAPETPYTVDDLEALLAGLTDDAGWAANFFDRYVRGRQVPDYATLLAEAGLLLELRNPGRPWIGAAQLADGPDGVEVRTYTWLGAPLYEAGVDQGDRILAIDGVDVATVARFDEVWQAAEPGDTLPVTFRSRGRTVSSTLRLVEDPRLRVVTTESKGEALPAGVRAFRRAWLDGPR